MRCSSASAIVLAVALAACTRSVTRAWLPSPANPRFTPESGSRTLGTYLAVECERLRGTPLASGDALLRATADSAGMVTRAEIGRGSGDEALDALFGTVAAQLRLAPAADGTQPPSRTVRVEWSCAEGAERAVITAP